MWFFPFRNIVLKTSYTRQEVSDAILYNTFLSDAGFRRSENTQQLFYGTCNAQEFNLETINPSKQLAGFFNGSIRGVDRDIYVFLSVRAFRYRRIYILILLFTLICLAAIASNYISYGMHTMGNSDTILLEIITLSLLIYLYYAGQKFASAFQRSVTFFKETLQAELIPRSNVPQIFRL